MITIKNKASLRKMSEAGRLLAEIMKISGRVCSGVSTLAAIDALD